MIWYRLEGDNLSFVSNFATKEVVILPLIRSDIKDTVDLKSLKKSPHMLCKREVLQSPGWNNGVTHSLQGFGGDTFAQCDHVRLHEWPATSRTGSTFKPRTATSA